MIVKIKKLYLDKYAEVRDYDVRTAKERGENIIILYQEERMTVKYQDLDKGTQTIKNISKYDGKEYWLIAYKWKKDPVKGGKLTYGKNNIPLFEL